MKKSMRKPVCKAIQQAAISKFYQLGINLILGVDDIMCVAHIEYERACVRACIVTVVAIGCNGDRLVLSVYNVHVQLYIRGMVHADVSTLIFSYQYYLIYSQYTNIIFDDRFKPIT